MVAAFRQWRDYVEGAVVPVQVYTNHKNLEYFNHARSTPQRHARWAATMAVYNYTISYCKGASNGKRDALSWRPDYIPPPLLSHPILSPPSQDPLLHTPCLRGAVVLLLPNDPLLPNIAVAHAADATISATMAKVQGGIGGESNPALPAWQPIEQVG